MSRCFTRTFSKLYARERMATLAAKNTIGGPLSLETDTMAPVIHWQLHAYCATAHTFFLPGLCTHP